MQTDALHLLSVNVGQPRALDVRPQGKPALTGIFKERVSGPVQVGALGLSGDHILDVNNHGGPDQAVYLYSAEDYDYFAETVGYAIAPGTFGENLTLSGFGTAHSRVGDRYQIGEVLLEITAPRIPCATFAARMHDLAWVKTFRQARRPGLYARVLQEGELRAGDPVTFLPADPSNISTDELFELFYATSPDPETLRRALQSPLAERARAEYQAELGQGGSPGVMKTSP